jgi:hypothetical protein
MGGVRPRHDSAPAALPGTIVAPAHRVRRLVPVLVLALLALIGGLFTSFSPLANLYVLLVGGALACLGLSGRLIRRPASVPLAVPEVGPDPVPAPTAARAPRAVGSRAVGSRAAAWWLVPVLLLGVVELVDFSLGSTYPHPTLSVLLDPVLDRYLARAAVYFGWLAAFWGLARR